jgi:ABC-2 type transport system permease protein
VKDLRLAFFQTRYALTGFLRNPRAFVFTIILPLFLLIILNTIFHDLTKFIGAKTAALYYTPAIISYQILLAGFNSLNLSVVTDREAGLLKRYRGTPMPSWVYLASLIGRTIVVVACAVAVLVVVGVVFYAVPLSADAVAGVIVYTLLGTVSMCTLGLAATRACTNVDTASVVGIFPTLVLAFVSGVFVPLALVPRWLIDIGRVFPLEYLAAGLRTAFGASSSTGITVENVGVLVGWGLAGMAVAVRTFAWEPMSRG